MRDFTEIARLETGTLRSLLETGDAPERVRAAWALALRLGGGVRPELIHDSLTEPNPGVRRHLVVVLAGYQERDVLATLASQDAEAEVRAVACQYLAMLGRPEDTRSWQVLHERLETDASADVCQAAIAWLPSHTPALLRDAVASRAEDARVDVRRAAADKLMEWAGLSGEGVPGVLVSRLQRESDPDLRQELVRRACALVGAGPLLSALVDAPEETLRPVLKMFKAQWVRPPWESLGLFTLRERTGLDELLMALLPSDAPAEADAWLLEVALRFWSVPNPNEEDVARNARDALWHLMNRFEAGYSKALDARGEALARELLERLTEARASELKAHPEWCDEPEHGECFAEEWGLDETMEALSRRVGRGSHHPGG